METQQNIQNPVERMLFRPKEAAAATGTSPSWIYARIADGSLRAVRLAGRAVRIKREDLLNFIEQAQ